jgi:hypothetical protein
VQGLCSVRRRGEYKLIKLNSKKKDYTVSQWYKHKNGKEPIVTELVEVDDSVRYLGFTRLEAHSISEILEILRRENIVPRIFYNPKEYKYRMIITVKPVSAWVAKRFCKYVLKEVSKLWITPTNKKGLTLSVDYFPKYSSRRSAITRTSNELKLHMYNGELVLRTLPPVEVEGIYEKWLQRHLSNDIACVPNVINDLSKYREMFYKQDEVRVKASLNPRSKR